MEKALRDELRKATQAIRRLLSDEFEEQLDGIFDIQRDGTILLGANVPASQRLVREKLVAAIIHKQFLGLSPEDAVGAYLREAAFTALNRFVALKMLEKRSLVQECVSRGDESSGFKEFSALAPGLVQLPDKGYRLYIEAMFDEIGQEVRVLFNRQDVASLLWPRRPALMALLDLINSNELKAAWGEDETIGWVYQYYNGNDVSEMRKAVNGGAPRNSHELAVRNQFFTPRYVVEFLTDNTLGRMWYEMTQGRTTLVEQCRYMVRCPQEVFLSPDDSVPNLPQQSKFSQEESLQQPTQIPHRQLKDPREIRMLDPACGSMHFGLYAFDLFEAIYDEAWDQTLPETEGLKPLREIYTSREEYLRDVPRLIIEHNIHGVDIDPRAAQIAGLSLWLRAQKYWQKMGLPAQERPRIRKSNVACAEPMPGETALLQDFIIQKLSATAEDRLLGQFLVKIFDSMELAGEAGSLLKIEEEITGAIEQARKKWADGPKPEQGLLFSDDKKQPEQIGLRLADITDASFWEGAEERIYAALLAYANEAEQVGGYQRRLFAGDTARGFSFIDVCRKRYDVILMNPPFGEPTLQTPPRQNSCRLVRI